MKSLFKSVAIITVFSVITRLFGFLFRIYLSRSIGAEELGVYQVAFSIFIVLITIVSSGLPLVISKLSAKHLAQNNKKQEGKMISSALVLAVGLSLCLCLFISAFSWLIGKSFADETSLLVLFSLLPAVVFSAVYSVFRGALWGRADYFGVCLAELIEQVLRIGICVLLVGVLMKNVRGSISAGASLSIACALSAIFVAILFFAKGGKLFKPDKSYKELIKTSTPITGVRATTSMIQPIIALLIPARLVSAGYTNAQAMALFGVAIGMTLPLLFIPATLVGSLSMAIIPDLSVAQTNNDENHISSRTTSAIAFSLFISSFLVPLFIGAGKEIGIFFFNNATSGILLAKSAWVMIPMGLTNITSAILNGLGLETKSFKHNVFGAIFLLLATIILPKFVGIYALTIGLGGCMIIISVLNLAMIRKRTTVKLKITKPLFSMILLMIPTSAITSFLVGILSHIFTLFFTLAVACSVGAILFLLLCMVFKIVDMSGIFVKIKKFKLKNMKIFKKNKKKA